MAPLRFKESKGYNAYDLKVRTTFTGRVIFDIGLKQGSFSENGPSLT